MSGKDPCPIQIIPCILQVDFQLLHFLMRFGVKRLGTRSRFGSVGSNISKPRHQSWPRLPASCEGLDISPQSIWKSPKWCFFILRIYTKHKSNVNQAEKKYTLFPHYEYPRFAILGSACVCMCALQATAVAEYEKAVCYSPHQQIISDYEIDRHFNNRGALCSVWISK